MSHDQIEMLTPNSRKRLEEQRVHGLDQMKLWATGIRPARLQCLPGLSHQGTAGMFPGKKNPTTLRYSQGQLEAEDQAVKSDISCWRPAVSHGSIKSDPEQATESSCGHIQWVLSCSKSHTQHPREEQTEVYMGNCSSFFTGHYISNISWIFIKLR